MTAPTLQATRRPLPRDRPSREDPPVVLLHGAEELDGMWSRVLPDLAETHRVIAPGLPGHGATAPGGSALGAEPALRWLDELIDRTTTAPPAIVGHALGGLIAARFAARRPDRVRGLVLVDSPGLAQLRPSPKFAMALIPFMVRPTKGTHDRLLQRCVADLDELRAAMGERLDLVLARITAPTTLIWSRPHARVGLSVARTASARYGWPLHVIDAAGGDPAVECPEEFLHALRAGLDATEENR